MNMKNAPGNINNRRQKALLRLEDQLKSGVKLGKRPVTGIDVVLDEDDIKRIKEEIKSLHSSITSEESARLVRAKKYRATR